MFEICLFDLDETLVRTEDLKAIREAGKNNSKRAYPDEVRAALDSEDNRHIYSLETLNQIRSEFPNLKLGIFTRAPRKYAQTVLKWAYPRFDWDIVVAYEDVAHTKPNGEGIDKAMQEFDVDSLDRVIVVGDADVDIRSAYHCGCVVALDRGGWPYQMRLEHWRALKLIPDAVIRSPAELLEVLAHPKRFLPELERALARGRRQGSPRFEKLSHWIPDAAGGGGPYWIYTCGRSFADYPSLSWRRGWHELTQSIEENKDSEVFPDEWIDTVRTFIANHFAMAFSRARIKVTVVPHRPDREPRLEAFLAQLEASFQERPIGSNAISFHPSLLAYRTGVRSHHGEHLNQEERFLNVRDHLYVRQPNRVTSDSRFLIIDDVVTTGASLIYSEKYLKEAGAGEVVCLSLAKNVSDVLWT